MPTYVPYSDSLETIADDEADTKAKIIEVMTDGQHFSREKYGESVRISHAKAHALLKGELIIPGAMSTLRRQKTTVPRQNPPASTRYRPESKANVFALHVPRRGAGH